MESFLLDGGVNAPAGAASTAMARLQHLELFDVNCAQAVETRLFPHLTDLTSLGTGGDAEGLLSCFPPHISSMASLQQLRLAEAGPITAATLPGIDRLTAVQNLELVGGDLEPSCLLPLTTGLTRLSLEDIILQPESGPLGVSQLLQLLAQLTALRDLSLSSIEGDWPQQQLAQYSALTASSNLQELRMYDCDIPGAAWLHVLPAGRKLPQLRLFSRWEYGRAACGAADIARLISCCPAVEDLNFTPAADASLAPLQSLSALTRLVIHEVSPAVIRSDLTALSQLRSLLCFLPAAAPAGEATSSELQHLVPLTALTGLTEFGGEFDGCVWMLSSNAPAGSPPDVWAQLLEKCAADAAAQPAVISSVVRQLQQHQQDTQEQVAAARAEAAAEAAELRGQLQTTEAEVTQLQQQHTQDLAATRAEAAAA